MALPSTLKFFNFFIDGRGFQGEVAEITLPKITKKTEDYRGGGMLGTVAIEQGFDKIELEHKYNGLNTNLFTNLLDDNINSLLCRFLGTYQADDTNEVKTVEIIVRGRHTEIDMGSVKAGDLSTKTIKTSCTYYKLLIDGAEIIEVDLISGIYKVKGIDQTEKHRTFLGLN